MNGEFRASYSRRTERKTEDRRDRLRSLNRSKVVIEGELAKVLELFRQEIPEVGYSDEISRMREQVLFQIKEGQIDLKRKWGWSEK